MKKNEIGDFKGMVPLLTFQVLYMLTGFISGDFESMPLMIGIILAITVALFMNNPKDKKSLDEKITIFAKRAGNDGVMLRRMRLNQWTRFQTLA